VRMVDIITKKKHGEVLTDDEIKFFVDGYTCGDIPDYQASALCMAVCFCGMTEDECASLTQHMMHSGDVVDLSSLNNTVDKHSTGGVGDKTSLIVAPVAAALGCSVAKMSGRGLGHTGGTIDKLESIPGYSTSIDAHDFMDQVQRIGVSIIGQTGNLAPADKKLYALRDVTSTVDSLPLIASSIMSKKLASGARSIVLDVKCGSGAFMKTPEDAKKLAEAMVAIGKNSGRNICAVITDMDKPLGRNIGNSLEIIEAVKVLRGECKGDLFEICVVLAGNMVSLARGIGYDEACEAVRDVITSGKAYQKFLEWISAQGGDISYITEDKLSVGKYSRKFCASRAGYISRMNAEMIGVAACALGAGRARKDDEPDLSAGIVLDKLLGNKVAKGDSIFTLYTSDESKLEIAEGILASAVEITDSPSKKIPLVYDIVR